MNRFYLFLTLQLELHQMTKYLELVQDSLSQNIIEIEADFQEDIDRGKFSDMDEDEAFALLEQHEDAVFELSRSIPQFILCGFIISWYSLVEQKLLDLCQALDLSVSIGPKDNESMGKGIRRARRFLLKAKDYEIDNRHWQELITIGRLRNILVHEGKHLSCHYLKPDDKYVIYSSEDGLTLYIEVEDELFRYLQQHNLLKISVPPHIDILPSFEYCEYLLEFCEEFFSKLYKDLYPNQHTANV